jgi:hypothetical protein
MKDKVRTLLALPDHTPGILTSRFGSRMRAPKGFTG